MRWRLLNMLDNNKIVEYCDELLARGIMSGTEGSARGIPPERALRACAIHAVNKGLRLMESAADFVCSRETLEQRGIARVEKRGEATFGSAEPAASNKPCGCKNNSNT